MLAEDWEDVSTESLLRAIENGYSEGKELEFKRQQNPDNSGHKQSTVAEVVSFANGSGGDLVIGLVDEEGVASGLWPVRYEDIDELVLRWVDIIKRNTDPELPQHLVEIKPLEVTAEHEEYVDEQAPSRTGYILAIRIRRSWRAPHRETVKNQFYERSAGGKTPLDTGAIRRAMLQGELVVERAQEFRDDRLSAIQADDIAVPLLESPKVVLHIVPSNAFAADGVVNPSSAEARRGTDDRSVPSLLYPRRVVHAWSRYTEDGFLVGSRYEQYENRFGSYTLTFRSGVIEALTTRSYIENGEYISSGHVRSCFEESLPSYIDFLSQEGGAFPIYCFFSVIGAKGLPVGSQRTVAHRDHDDLETIDRDVARLPAARVETPEVSLDPVIDTLLDSLYNASGKGGEPQVD